MAEKIDSKIYLGEPEINLLEKVAGLIGKIGIVASYCDCSTCACGSCSCNCSCNACGACYCDCTCSSGGAYSFVNFVNSLRSNVGHLQEIVNAIKTGNLR